MTLDALFVALGLLGWFMLWSQVPSERWDRVCWIVFLGGTLIYFSGVLAGMAGK